MATILDDTPDSFGFNVAGAGDENGDGLDHVIVSGHTNDPAFDDGYVARDPLTVPDAAYVVFGERDTAPVSSADIRAGRGGGFAISARRRCCSAIPWTGRVASTATGSTRGREWPRLSQLRPLASDPGAARLDGP